MRSKFFMIMMTKIPMSIFAKQESLKISVIFFKKGVLKGFSLLDPQWEPEGSYKIGCLQFRLSGCFLGIVSLIFSKFWHSARVPCEVVCDRVGFSKKKNCHQNWENRAKMGLKRFFQFIGNLGHNVLLNLIYNENLYLLCSSTNRILEKTFVPEIRAKMFSANLIAGFFNQPYLQNKLIKQPDVVHFGTNSYKLKFWGGLCQRWVWPARSHDSKIDCIPRMS